MLPTFVNPSLAVAGLIAMAVPVLIHLINVLRHRRIEWAAMEFLLESQKKNSRWILLKQLLLLLFRMAAVAAVGLIVAQPLLRGQWLSLFGGLTRHHIVLLDDTFSATDRWGDTSAFSAATGYVAELGKRLAEDGGAHSFTLVRFSQAGSLGGRTRADFLKRIVDAGFGVELDDSVASLEASQLSVSPEVALAAIDRLDLILDNASEVPIVHVVTDLRARDWLRSESLRGALLALEQQGASLRIVDCVADRRPHENLAIAQLHPRPGARVADVPILFDVAVTNFGTELVRDVEVSIRVVEGDADLVGAAATAQTVAFDQITAGGTEVRGFQALFSTAGQHEIVARLPPDAVDADNTRFCVADVTDGVRVLLIDSGPEQLGARFVATALRPGGDAKTGLAPQIERPAFLNNHPLDEFGAVYLLDVEHIDDAGIRRLEDFVRQGGGLGLFVGERTRATFMNEKLYRNGEGLLPVPLFLERELEIDRLEATPDLKFGSHPVFQIFRGERNPFVGMVGISRYFSLPRDFALGSDTTTKIVAELRNGAPLVVERLFGKGRVMAFLTTAAPTWNNWARNPSYVITLLELQAYLASSGAGVEDRLVGLPLRLSLDASRYAPPLEVDPPLASTTGTIALEAVPDGPQLEGVVHDTAIAGTYTVRLQSVEGEPEIRRYSLNVDPREGDLGRADSEQLAAVLQGVTYRLLEAADYEDEDRTASGSRLSDGLLYLLVVLLLGEQALAYSASYHPPARQGVR